MKETIDFLQQVKISSKGAIRVFALGIGQYVSHKLVEGIAKAGGRYAEIIPSTSQGGWESRVVAVLEAALRTHLSTLCIKAEGLEEDGDVPNDSDAGKTRLPYPLRQPYILTYLR